MTYRESTDDPEPAQFSLAGMGPFDGFDLGGVWNGWACPHFTKEQAEEVAEGLAYEVGSGAFETAEYDEERDAFVFDHPDLPEPDVFPRDEETDLYPVGAYSWTWDRVD